MSRRRGDPLTATAPVAVDESTLSGGGEDVGLGLSPELAPQAASTTVVQALLKPVATPAASSGTAPSVVDDFRASPWLVSHRDEPGDAAWLTSSPVACR